MDSELWKIALEEVLNLDRVDEVDQVTIDKLREMAIDASEWCWNPLVDESLRSKACQRFYELISRFLTTLVKLRASKVMEGAEPKGFDRKMLSTVIKALEIFAELLILGLRVHEGEVLCRVLKPVSLKKSIASPGYLVSMPLWEAAIMAALGYVEPLTLRREIISF